jgi:hypothetical protein
MNNLNGNTSNNNTLYLMLCELHYPGRHGKTMTSDPNIETHYLVYDRFDPITGISFTCFNEDDDAYNTDDDTSNSDDDDALNKLVRINDEIVFLKRHYENKDNFNPLYFGEHPTIRNYHTIISKQNYIKPEIGQYIILPTQEAVAILKTFWIRIIQRKWKKVFQERKEKLRLNYDESNLPSLKGMLNTL